MKSLRLAGLALLSAGVLFAQAAAPAARDSNAPVFMPSADVKWVEDPNAPGVSFADIWGDHTKTGYGAFIKFPAGFTAPLHTHSHAAKLVVISGTLIQVPEGKPEVRLGPGSYLMQPGKTYRHVTKCDKASECLVFSESTGAFDLIPVEGAGAPAKK
jgi:quercetin dioxygenase-like cupin family protein